MADSGAVRAKRAKAHARGDHSLCNPDRCAVARGEDPLPAATMTITPDENGERQPGQVETGVRALVATMQYEPSDPRAILADIAVRLAQRVDETGAPPAAAKELRVLLAQLAEVPNAPSGPVDELRLRRAQRRLDGIIVQAD